MSVIQNAILYHELKEIPHVPAFTIVTAATFRNDILVLAGTGGGKQRSAERSAASLHLINKP